MIHVYKEINGIQVKDWEELHHMANTLAKVDFLLPKIIFKIMCMKGSFLDSLGRDYYVIGTASDIQVNVVRDKRQKRRHFWI